MTKLSKTNHLLHTLTARIIIGVLIPILLLLGAWYLSNHTSPFICVFYQTTGLYCPGCGTGRAAYDLLHFNFVEAVGHNIFFVIALPFFGYYFIKVYIAYVFNKDILPFFRISYKQGVIITVAIIVYWIVRNVPVWPFTLLAP